MTTITVYDPPMCCSTGICGPEIDPKLAQFAGDLDWLKEQGIKVERVNLAQEPARFVENSAVKNILDQSGGDDLPAVVVGDRVVVNGRYPCRDELARLVGLSTNSVSNEISEQMFGADETGAARSASCCGAKASKE